MPQYPATTHRKGLSLIELLVGIAIMALLLTITFSSVHHMRDRAASVQCFSHLRQLANAYTMYIADQNGQMLPANIHAGHEFSEGHNFAGIRVLRRYYSSGPPYQWDESGNEIFSPLETCPAGTLSNMPGGYGTSDYLQSNTIDFFQTPARTPILWDGWTGNWLLGRTLPLRHGGINCAFLDGHVEYIPKDDERLYSNYWYHAMRTASPRQDMLGKGTALGSAKAP